MTPEEAKRTLAFYRPGSADDDDPAFAEPLSLADPGRKPGPHASQIDPQLSRWFREHCSAYLGVRGKFLDIQPPPALKDQILAEYKSHITPMRSQRRVMLACVAGVLVMAAFLTVFFLRRAQRDFSVYRHTVVVRALRPNYIMDMESKDSAAIKTYLAGRHAPINYQLPASLKSAEPAGCAVIDWHGKLVTMLCFRSGKPFEPGEPPDLWLFVANQEAVLNAPTGVSRAVTEVDRMATAAWSQGGELYMLAIIGDESLLQKYF